jgi:predicted ATPase
MIRKIYIDGFKSFSKFNFTINEGLNILVGPNGAGKTNLIQFLEFFSNLHHDSLSEVLSKFGGIGSIFQKVDENEFKNKITLKISGDIKKKKKKIFYQYSCSIYFSKKTNLLYFQKQKLEIKFGENSDWDLSIETKTKDSLKSDVIINKLDKRKFKSRFSSKTKYSEQEVGIKTWLSEKCHSNSIIELLVRVYFDNFFDILNDLYGGEIYNIIPSKVKESEDIAKYPQIKKDGSGLATTLYHLKNIKNKKSKSGVSLFPFFNRRDILKNSPETFERIIKNVKLANMSIEGIDVINDAFDNQLNVKININSESGKIALPLSSMSDGTSKWISLITAILTSESIFSIEEPENYLHPWMQAQILAIIREISTKNNKFVFLTTHSESLLNAAKPEEVVIISMENGKTIAKRIENIKLLKEEISETGFGIGHYYNSGAF